MDSEMENDKKPEIERRTFLRKVGVTALATAWAAPIIQSVPASIAHATGMQTPHPGDTSDSSDDDSGGSDDGGGGGDSGGGSDDDDDWGGGGSGGGSDDDD